MTVLALHHVQLAMPEGGEREAVAFYEGVLGLAEVPKPPAMAARGGCWFEEGGVRVHLGVEADFRPARKAHPALVVDDLAAVLDRVRRHGAAVHEADRLDGFTARAFVDDPFGNRLELLQT